ncbi:MAG: Fumarate hydratase class II [Candidatus Thorarchaeota archaeon]|nr:MAG: Fumarate hydratase class II [Candidatus Thorarchaeota archaeon]
MSEKRIEHDVLGEMAVPADAYWGISTQRAIQNFHISGKQLPAKFIHALAEVKKACLLANMELGNIDKELGKALLQAIDEITSQKKMLDQFPVDIYQTGSGTQTNMNMNEVLANRANEILGSPLGEKKPVHPNDHVNMGQSSNDVIPTAMHVAALDVINKDLLPAIDRIIHVLDKKVKQFRGIVKVGRTHLQDAVPIPLSMEFSVYRTQLVKCFGEIQEIREDLVIVPIGGTALGTGLNSSDKFAEQVVSHLETITGNPFRTHFLKAEGIASHRTMVRLSSSLKLLALALIKMANDIRWMGSGPRAGLGELDLPANEPGSSIMPGKINPTQSEALIQVGIQVLGYDHAISMAESLGSILDLCVTKPLIISNILDSIHILTNGIKSFSDNCLEGLEANEDNIQSQLDRSLMIATRLTPYIGYDKASEVARKALESGKTIRETLQDMNISIENLDEILDPHKMV